jgi:signal recognition particle subunit SEC65
MAVKNPSLEELVEAVKRLGFEGEPFKAKHPKRPRSVSGYVSIVKRMKKQELLRMVAKALMEVHGKVRSG